MRTEAPLNSSRNRQITRQVTRKVLAFISSLAGQPGVELAGLPWTGGSWALDLTSDEAKALRREMGELVSRYRRRSSNPPPDAVRVHAAFQIVPEEE